MDLRLSEQQRLLQSSIDALLARECGFDVVRACDEGRASWPQVWDVLERHGYLRLPVSEQRGGSGGTLADAAIVLHRAGRFLLPGPLVDTFAANLMVNERDRSGTADVRWRDGGLRTAIAWSERAAEQERHFETVLTDDRRLSGHKIGVYHVAEVPWLLVFARRPRPADPR